MEAKKLNLIREESVYARNQFQKDTGVLFHSP